MKAAQKAALMERVVSTDPQRREHCRRGGLNKARWAGSAKMAAQGQRGGAMTFLRYGSEGMRDRITQYWEEVRAGLRPPPRRGKNETSQH